MDGYSRVAVELGSRGTRIVDLQASGPLAVFPTDHTGDAIQVTLVAAAGGPVGGDRVVLDVDVGHGCELTVRSAGASVVLGGDDPSSMLVRASVAGTLRWMVEPLVVAEPGTHHAQSRIRLTEGAALWWQDEVVFGRAGEESGSCRLGLAVDRGGRPLLRHRLDVGAGAPGWDGPARLAGHRAVASVLLIQGSDRIIDQPAAWSPSPPSDRRARLVLEGGGSLLTAVGDDLTEARDDLRSLLPPEAWLSYGLTISQTVGRANMILGKEQQAKVVPT